MDIWAQFLLVVSKGFLPNKCSKLWKFCNIFFDPALLNTVLHMFAGLRIPKSAFQKSPFMASVKQEGKKPKQG